jgi:hypothetical protein
MQMVSVGQAAGVGGTSARRGWGRPRRRLDPLGVLLRERYPSRAELARERPAYQAPRNWTDGLWTADRLPPVGASGSRPCSGPD